MKYFTLLTAFALATSGCTTVADMAGYNTASLNAQSAKAYTQVMEKAAHHQQIDTTSHTAKRIHAVFHRMKPYAERANKTGVPFQWEMTVLRSSTLNAWAMPGGKMAFYTGLVEQLQLNDDEIAAVIGHEMTHALAEHSKKDAGQKILTSAVSNIGGAVLGAYTGVDPNLIQVGSSLISNLGVDKPFSRSQEHEADVGGLYLMAQAGYHPQYALTVWEKMSRLKGSSSFGLLSTHPSNQARINNMRKKLPEVLRIYQGSIKN